MANIILCVTYALLAFLVVLLIKRTSIQLREARVSLELAEMKLADYRTAFHPKSSAPAVDNISEKE